MHESEDGTSQNVEHHQRTIGGRLRDISRRKTPGAPPGTLTSDPQAAPVNIRLLHYDADSCLEDSEVDAEKLSELAKKPGVTWQC